MLLIQFNMSAQQFRVALLPSVVRTVPVVAAFVTKTPTLSTPLPTNNNVHIT